MPKAFLLALALLLSCATALAQTGDDALEAALRDVLERNFAAANAEDIVGYLLTVHALSPVFGVTQQALEPQFVTFDLSYDLLELRLIALDGDYAFARGRQRTVKLAGPDFADNVTEALYVFRQEAGAWKLWQQSPLEVVFLD